MKNARQSLPPDAKKLSPLEMNKLAILKDHTVITFSAPDQSAPSD